MAFVKHAGRLVACLALASASMTGGCGGGGSDYSSSNPQPTQNLQTATPPAQPWTIPSTTLTATDSSGNTYSVTASNTPGGSMTFNGQIADSSVLALSVSENGTAVSTDDTTAYYLTDPYSPLGFSGTTNGVAWTAIVTSYTPFPATLTVGSSGSLMSANYEDSMGNVIGGLTETYTVTADTPTDLLLNIDASGSVNGTSVSETLTYSITSSGALSLAQAQITVNGITLNFTQQP
jgi:hypothetical protein